MARFSPTLVASILLLSSVGTFAMVPTAAAAHSSYDVLIRGHENTFLAATVFIPEGATANSTPFILMTHGWAGSRTTTISGRVADFLDAGYGVLTWDSRGFGASGGDVELNSPDYEVKDVQAIITHLARFVPEAKLQSTLDPVVGMSGGSYAGGIQLLAAAFDDRIDVIAPEITWYDLAESLAPNGVPKVSWTTALFGAGLATSCAGGPHREFAPGIATTGCQTSDLALWYAEVHATNSISDDVRDALMYRSPKTYMSEIDIPTLIIQGYPDTLFDVSQAAANYAGIKANGAPVKMWVYDGGHALPGSTVPNTQAANITPTVITWMDRYLKGDANVDTGPEAEYFIAGQWHSATQWPPASAPQTHHINGVPPLGQGPIMGGSLATTSVPILNGPARITGPVDLSFDASGLNVEAIVYASLGIQTGTTIVRVDGQVQPIRMPIDPNGLMSASTQLVQVGANVPDGSKLVLTLTSWERDYGNNRVPGFVNINNIDVSWLG